MKSFIGYFDYLGFKEFLLRNTETTLRRRASHILRDIETSLSQEKLKQAPNGDAIADLSTTNINCLNISDTVIFWTPDDSIDRCLELLNVCYLFNYKQVMHNFPVRGCIIYDNFDFITGQTYNPNGALYSPNLMYGKGLLNAHEKAEMLNWAGTVIDVSVIDKYGHEQMFQQFLQQHALRYKVPYKGFYRKEYAMRLSSGPLGQAAFTNYSKGITDVFEMDNKSIPPSVEEKIKNTIEYLSSFKQT